MYRKVHLTILTISVAWTRSTAQALLLAVSRPPTSSCLWSYAEFIQIMLSHLSLLFRCRFRSSSQWRSQICFRISVSLGNRSETKQYHSLYDHQWRTIHCNSISQTSESSWGCSSNDSNSLTHTPIDQCVKKPRQNLIWECQIHAAKKQILAPCLPTSKSPSAVYIENLII